MDKDDAPKKNEILAGSTKSENVLDLAAMVTSVVPWIGGPVSIVLSGMSINRKFDRVKEVLDGLTNDLKDFKSEASEKYVKTDEFGELLEKTLLKSADERNEQKRKLYRAFLTHEIKSPGKSYDEQLRYLRTMEGVQPDHLRMLKAIADKPKMDIHRTGSPLATLQERLPDMSADQIRLLVIELHDLHLSNLTSLNGIMTYNGAQDLQHHVTPYGQSFLDFILYI